MIVHSFVPEEAKKYGILAAVILQSIRFWVEKNRANGKHFHDGRHWTYNSARAWAELLPYASEDQIQRALKSLVEAGVLLTGVYNESPYDRTKWYSLSIDSAELRNETPQNCGNININSSKPVSKTDMASPSSRSPRSKDKVCLEDFIKNEKEQDRKFFHEDLRAWMTKTETPEDILGVHWYWFKNEFSVGRKYKDWRATFRKSVLEVWGKLFAIDSSGTYYLTTAGKQIQAMKDKDQ